MTEKHSLYVYPTILFALLGAYAFSDVMSSAQAGFRDTAREDVYTFLSAVISFLMLYGFLKTKKRVAASSLSLLLWTITIWVGIVNLALLYDQWVAVVHLSLSFWWIFSYYFFYSYLSRNPASENYIKSLFIAMFFFYVWANIFIRQNILESFDMAFAITGHAYYLVIFIPFFFLLKTNWLKILLVVLATVMIVTSYKRGPIVILPLMLLVHELTLAFSSKRWLPFILKTVLIGALIAGVFVYVDEESDEFLSYRFSEEELESGSGRDVLREQSIENITERSWDEMLMGTGSGSSIDLLGTGAHNEWIEFLFSFGIVGVLLFGAFCTAIVKRYVSLLRAGSRYASPYGMATVFLLMVSLFSGFYFTHWSFYFFAFLGFAEALIAQERDEQKPAENI